MPANPKKLRIVDKKHLARTRTLPCIVKNSECSGGIVAHHVATVGSGGSDLNAVPMCIWHHAEIHFIGRDSFQEKYGINFKKYIEKIGKYYGYLCCKRS